MYYGPVSLLTVEAAPLDYLYVEYRLPPDASGKQAYDVVYCSPRFLSAPEFRGQTYHVTTNHEVCQFKEFPLTLDVIDAGGAHVEFKNMIASNAFYGVSEYTNSIQWNVRLFDPPAFGDEVVVMAQDLSGKFFRWYGLESQMPAAVRDLCTLIKNESFAYDVQTNAHAYFRAHVMSIQEELSLPENTPRYEPSNYAPLCALVPLSSTSNPESAIWPPGSQIKSSAFGYPNILMGWQEFKLLFPNVKGYHPDDLPSGTPPAFIADYWTGKVYFIRPDEFETYYNLLPEIIRKKCTHLLHEIFLIEYFGFPSARHLDNKGDYYEN